MKGWKEYEDVEIIQVARFHRQENQPAMGIGDLIFSYETNHAVPEVVGFLRVVGTFGESTTSRRK